MKNNFLTAICTALVGVATATVLGAQTTTTPQQQTPPATTTASAEKTITVVGCLRPAGPSSADTTAAAGATGTAGTAGTTSTTTAGTTGTSGTTASTAAPAADAAQQKFLLMDASIAPADAGTTSTAGAASATTTSPQSGQKETYRLIANGNALNPHVGKKLELTGTLEANSQTAADTTSGPDAGKPTLRVASGRIVAASCDQQ